MSDYIFMPPKPNRGAAYAQIIASALAENEARKKDENAKVVGNIKSVLDKLPNHKWGEYLQSLPEDVRTRVFQAGIGVGNVPHDPTQINAEKRAGLLGGHLDAAATAQKEGKPWSPDPLSVGFADPEMGGKAPFMGVADERFTFANQGQLPAEVVDSQKVAGGLMESAAQRASREQQDAQFQQSFDENVRQFGLQQALRIEESKRQAAESKARIGLIGAQTNALSPTGGTKIGDRNFSPETVAAGEDVMRGGDINRVPWADRMKVFEYVAAKGGKALAKDVQDKIRGQYAAEVALGKIEQAMQDYTSTPKTDLVGLARKAVQLRSTLMQGIPLIARGVGHTGVLTQQDFDSIVQGITGAKGSIAGLGLTYALPEDAQARVNNLRSQFADVQNKLLQDLVPQNVGPAEKTVSRAQLQALATAEGKSVEQLAREAVAEGFKVVP